MTEHEYVLSMYHYDPETGIFTYKKSSGCRKAGQEVGWADASNGIKYLITKVRRQKTRLHRLAFFYMEGRWPNQIDHINGDGTDNRWANIREVFDSENNMNTKVLKNNKTGIHGVNWYKNRCWRAYISVDRKQIPLGYFDSFFDACCARKSKENALGFHPNHGATWRPRNDLL